MPFDLDYSEVTDRKVLKTPEGTFYVETYYRDGAVSERYFQSPQDAWQFVRNA